MKKDKTKENKEHGVGRGGKCKRVYDNWEMLRWVVEVREVKSRGRRSGEHGAINDT